MCFFSILVFQCRIGDNMIIRGFDCYIFAETRKLSHSVCSRVDHNHKIKHSLQDETMVRENLQQMENLIFAQSIHLARNKDNKNRTIGPDSNFWS